MENFLLIHIPFEKGKIRIYKTHGSKEDVFELMKMVVLNEVNGITNLDNQLESKGYRINNESGIIYNDDNEWKLISELEIINL